jgi:hypothetical protein
MEAIFAELTNEDGEYGYSVNWSTNYVKNEITGKLEHIEDPKHDTFEYDGISFWWYHPENIKHPDTPVLVASWSVQKREDDFDEYEEEIDADVESIIDLIKSTETGHYYER